MSAVRATAGELTHERKHSLLDRPVDSDFPQPFQRTVELADRIAVAGVDGQLVADRPAPSDIAALDRGQKQLARRPDSARRYPSRGVGQHRPLATPDLRAHRCCALGSLSRSMAPGSSSKPPSSIAAKSSSAAARRSRPAASWAADPSTASRRTNVASASRVPVAARTRSSAPASSPSAITAILRCLLGNHRSVAPQSYSARVASPQRTLHAVRRLRCRLIPETTDRRRILPRTAALTAQAIPPGGLPWRRWRTS